MKAEEWKQIVIDDVEYDYSVSNYGRVRNDKTGQFLKPYEQGRYLQVCLNKNKRRKQLQVHRLVATMFIPNDEPTVKTIVHHKDHNTRNNHVENLEWATQQFNVEDGRGKRVRCVETGVIYDSITKASEFLGVSVEAIRKACLDKRKCKKLHWEFVD